MAEQDPFADLGFEPLQPDAAPSVSMSVSEPATPKTDFDSIGFQESAPAPKADSVRSKVSRYVADPTLRAVSRGVSRYYPVYYVPTVGKQKGGLKAGETWAGFVEMVSDAVGAQNAKQFYKEQGDESARLANAIPKDIKDIRDIKSAGDVGIYALESVGELAPQLAISLLTGGTARASGASKFGTFASVVAPSFAQESGSIYRGIREETGKEEPGIAALAGLASGSLEAVTPARFLSKFFNEAGGEAKKLLWRNLVRRTLAEVPKAAGTEFATEAVQEGIALMANKFADDTYNLVNGENMWRVLNAGAQGMFGGAGLGMVTPTLETAQSKMARGKKKEVIDRFRQDTAGIRQQFMDAKRIKAALEESVKQATQVAQLKEQDEKQPLPPKAVETKVEETPVVPPTVSSATDTKPAETVLTPPAVQPETPVAPPPVPPPAPATPESPETTSGTSGTLEVPISSKFEVTTPPASGSKPIKATGEWDIVDASQLDTRAGVTDVQERNRRSAQSKQQIVEIAQKLDPKLLGESNTTADGAPITDASGKILAGYGRTSAIKQAYDSETPQAQAYRDFVAEKAKQFGIEGKLQGVKNPVLIRRVGAFDGGDASQFAAGSNINAALQFTPAEMALSDARIIRENNLMDQFSITEDGQVNRGFLDALYNQMKERGGLKTTDGQNYLPAMHTRAKVAVLSALLANFPNSELLIRRLIEQAGEWSIQHQVNGLMAAAGKLLKVEQAAPELGLSKYLGQALTDYVSFRQDLARGLVDNFEQWLGQADFLSAASPESDLILAELARAKSGKAVAEYFDRYVRGASEIVKGKGMADMFGGSPEQKPVDILRRIKTDEKSKAVQTELTPGPSPTNIPKSAKPGGETTGVSKPASQSRPITDLPTVIQKALSVYKSQLEALGVPIVVGPAVNQSGIEVSIFDGFGQRSLVLDPEKIQENLANIAGNMKVKTPSSIAKAQRNYVEASIEEEVIHLATGVAADGAFIDSKAGDYKAFINEYLGALYNEMTPAERLMSVRAYTGDETATEQSAGLSPGILVAEFVRQIIQAKQGSKVSESVGATIRNRPGLTEFLNRFLIALRDLISKLKNDSKFKPRLKDAVKRIEKVLEGAQGGVTTDVTGGVTTDVTGGVRADEVTREVKKTEDQPSGVRVGSPSLDPKFADDYRRYNELASERQDKVSPFAGRLTPELQELNNSLLSKMKEVEPSLKARDLSEWTPTLVRQTSAADAVDIINGNLNRLVTTYWSNTPDLALSQRKNAAVTLELDSRGIKGRVNTSKPMWDVAWRNGFGEFVTESPHGNDPQIFADNIRRVVVDPTIQDRRFDIQNLQKALRDLTARGWVRSEQDGKIVYTKPEGMRVGAVATSPDVARRSLETTETRGVPAQELEASNIAGQVGFLERKFREHLPAGVDPQILDAAVRRLGYIDILSISALAKGIVPPGEYRNVLNRLPPEFRSTYAKEVGMRLKLTKEQLKEVIAEAAVAEKYITSNAFLNRLTKVNQAAALANTLDLAKKYFETDTATAMAAAKKIMESEAKNQGRAEAMLRALKSRETQKGFGEAVKQAVGDVVNVISKDEQAAQILYQGKPSVREIIDTYTRIKNELLAKGQTQPMQDKMIIRWAAEIISRSNEMARNMIALAVLRDNQEVRDQFTATQQKLADELKQNPVTVTRRMLKQAAKFGTKTERANAAFAALNKDVMKELRDFEVQDTAARVAKDFLADPETQAYEKEVYKDGKIQDRPRDVVDEDYDNLSLENGIGLPDGTRTDPLYLYGDESRFQRTVNELDKAANTITTWLAANPNDPSQDYWRRKYQYIRNILTTARTFNPSKLVAPVSMGPWGMTKFFADDIATRQGGVLKVSLANHARADELAKGLLHENFSKLTNGYVDALKSHGIKTDISGFRRYYDEILNPLLASWGHPEGGKNTGETVNGHEITKEDMRLVEFMARVTTKGFDIVQRDITKGREGIAQPVFFKTEIGDTGVPLHVQSTPITKNTTTRSYSQQGLGFVEGYQAEKDPARRWQMLNANFWNVVVPELKDRASVFFDGPGPFEDAFKLISQNIDRNGLALADRNMGWLVNQLHAITGFPPADIQAALQEQFDKLVQRLHNEVGKEDQQAIKVEALEQKSALTKARKQALAGNWLYNYGFKNSASLINFAMAISGYYYERAASDFLRVKADLERQKRELEDQIRVERTRSGKSEKESREAVIKRQSEMVKQGKTFDDYVDIERKIELADRYAKQFASIYGRGGKDIEFDLTALNRVVGAATGSVLMSELTALRNLGTGWYYIGNMLNSIEGTTMAGYVRSAVQTWLKTMPRYLGSLGLSLAKAGTAGAAKGIKAGFLEVRNKNYRKAIAKAFEPMLEEITRSTFERVKLQKELYDKGYAFPNYATDDVLAKLQVPTMGGAILDEQMSSSALGRLGYGMLSIYDAMVLSTVGRPLLPKFADAAVNHAAMQSAFDMVSRLRDQLVKVYEYRKANKIPLSDPLSANEALGKWFGATRTNNNLAQLRQLFEWSPITYDDAAQRLFRLLSAGQKDAALLTADEALVFADGMAQEVNKAAANNRPLQFKKKGLWQIVAPLLGWNAKMFRNYVKWFSRAGVDKDASKSMLWGSIGLLTILPFLVFGAIDDVGTEEMARLLYRYLRGEERATRQPWEREGLKSQLRGWAISAANPIPFVQTLVNSAINDMPNKASSDPKLFAQSKLMDVLNYAGGVAQTGDMTYGLPRLVKGFIPISSMFLNRIDATEGSVEALNARRILTRYGPQELLSEKSGFGAGANASATELTPYGERMLNAAMRGSDEEFMAVYDEAVKKATEMGRRDPEKVVQQMFNARNPYNRAFKQRLTPAQKEQMLSRMTTDERAAVQSMEDKFSHAASMIGGSPTFVKSSGGGDSGMFASPFGSATPVPRFKLKNPMSRYRRRPGSRKPRLSRVRKSRLSRSRYAGINFSKGRSRRRRVSRYSV